MPPPPDLPDSPEQYAVYRGRVTNVMDFGCFVELHGLRQRSEGLVHLANISKTRHGASLVVNYLGRKPQCALPSSGRHPVDLLATAK